LSFVLKKWRIRIFDEKLIVVTSATNKIVHIFHILQTSELAIISRNPPQISKTSKSENFVSILKYVAKNIHA
jgi:hypothetical protein